MVDVELTKGGGHHLNAIKLLGRHRKVRFKLSDIKLQ